MEWLKDIIISLIGFLVGYMIRRSMEEEFHIPCSDDEDVSWK